jgi:hypothetical protein
MNKKATKALVKLAKIFSKMEKETRKERELHSKEKELRLELNAAKLRIKEQEHDILQLRQKPLNSGIVIV